MVETFHLSKGKNIIAGEIYRVPGTNEQEFLCDYEDLLKKINLENKEIIIGSDQNLDYLKINRHQNTAKFLEINLSSNLIPTITKPTRVTHTSATLIDNIYVSTALSNNTQSNIILSDISDHFPCLTFIGNIKPENKNPLILNVRKVTIDSIQQIEKTLSEYNWDVLNVLDANDGYNLILNEITTKLNQECPEKNIIIPSNKIIREPWMTKGLIKSSQEKDKLFRKSAGLDKTNPKYLRYLTFRNKYNSLKRTVKQKYYCDKIEYFRRNSKKLWSTMQHMINSKHDKSQPIDTFLIDGKMMSDPKMISNEFCKYFTNISKHLANKVPASNKSFQQYLGDSFEDSFFFIPTDENEIEKYIKTLPNKTSSGYDGFKIQDSRFKILFI